MYGFWASAIFPIVALVNTLSWSELVAAHDPYTYTFRYPDAFPTTEITCTRDKSPTIYFDPNEVKHEWDLALEDPHHVGWTGPRGLKPGDYVPAYCKDFFEDSRDVYSQIFGVAHLVDPRSKTKSYIYYTFTVYMAVEPASLVPPTQDDANGELCGFTVTHLFQDDQYECTFVPGPDPR